MRIASRLIVAALAASALAGCNSEEVIGNPPIAQLGGPWLMVNRSETCGSSWGQFGPAGFYRVYDGKTPSKKYFDVKQFTVGAGTVMIAAENFVYEPSILVKMTFSVADGRLRLTDLVNYEDVSYKKPPKTLDADLIVHMQTVYKLTEEHFAMDRCPATS